MAGLFDGGEEGEGGGGGIFALVGIVNSNGRVIGSIVKKSQDRSGGRRVSRCARREDEVKEEVRREVE